MDFSQLLNDDELKKELLAAQAEKARLRQLGSIGENLSNRQGFGNFFLGKMNPNINTSALFDSKANEVSDPWEIRKSLLSAYKLKLEEENQAKENAFKEREVSVKEKAEQTKALLARAKGKSGTVTRVNPETGEIEIVSPSSGKQLQADKVLKVNEGNSIPNQLKDIEKTIDDNQDEFGPISGRLSSLNPWNEKAKTMDAQIRASAQAFGRFMEGGVLRKEDEEKYQRMFPSLADTPEVAKNKLAIVNRLLGQKQNSDVRALSESGYDVSGVRQNIGIPEVPKVLAKKKTSGDLIPEAHASQGSEVREVNGALYQKVKGGWKKL